MIFFTVISAADSIHSAIIPGLHYDFPADIPEFHAVICPDQYFFLFVQICKSPGKTQLILPVLILFLQRSEVDLPVILLTNDHETPCLSESSLPVSAVHCHMLKQQGEEKPCKSAQYNNNPCGI